MQPHTDDLLSQLRADLSARYRIERELRGGGMGRVFVAQDLRHPREVAIKILPPELAAGVGARFLREIELASKLSHPHILPLFDSGEAAGSLFYVMPFIPGDSLQERIRREHQLPIGDAVRIAREVADGLAYAHAQGIVHRDIKPGNILLSGYSTGEGSMARGHAIIADFGIARAVSEATGAITSAGLALGTPAYMSPEQASADPAAPDGRSDIYSLGCVLYEMLSGSPPFSAATRQGIAARHLTDPIPSLKTVRPNVPEHVEAAVSRALQKVPADRFSTAEGFRAALARPKEGKARDSKAVRVRRRWTTTALIVGGLALAVILAISTLARNRASSLDSARVVVFPLSVSGDSTHGLPSSENVTVAMVAALNSTQLIKGVNGWRLSSDEPHRARLSAGAARRLALRTNAGFYIDGRIITGDSTRAVVELHDLRGDSTLERTVTLPPSEDAWTIGVTAARDLLPWILGSGATINLSALGSPSPAAAAAYLLGNHAFRLGHFEEAATHFAQAVESDSTFAMAAVSAAEAAGWARDDEKGQEFIRIALRQRGALGPRYTSFLLGLAAIWHVSPDTAVANLRKALAHDPVWPEAWAELGEVYSHLLPNDPAADSLQSESFERSRGLDPGFIPPLYHLVEIALRRGDVKKAEQFLGQMNASAADSADIAALALMLRCVKNGPERIDWEGEVRDHPKDVVDVGSALAVAALREPRCSEAAWNAVLRYDPATAGAGLVRRYRALSGLQGLLVAEQRYEEAQRVLDGERRLPRARVWPLQIVAVIAGAPQEQQAQAAADSLRQVLNVEPRSPVALWALAVWEHHVGRAEQVRILANRAAAEMGKPGAGRLDTLVEQSLQGWASLAEKDTLRALKFFQQLSPMAGVEHWEALGAERMAMAEIQFRRAHYADAYRVASLFDSPAGVSYLLFMRKSLQVRAQAARGMSDDKLATQMEGRLAGLSTRGGQQNR
jgi:serine/threonine protein kinase/tetratricopeptide (TPR) repeat protein